MSFSIAVKAARPSLRRKLTIGLCSSRTCMTKTAFTVEKRPFYVTEDGKGKPVMDLFA